MLRIGANEYELVRVHSGFSVALHAKRDDALGREQVWELEAHYVPGENYTPRADGEPEYLSLNIRSEEYQVADWRALSGLGLDTEETTWLGWCSLSNLLVGRYDKESWSLTDGWLEVERLRDYLFHCEYTGARKLADGSFEAVELKDDLPFKEIVAYVPINAADPVAAAKAMAKRTIGLNAFAETRLLPYNPQQKTYFSIHVNSHNRVTLQTPWRLSLA